MSIGLAVGPNLSHQKIEKIKCLLNFSIIKKAKKIAIY
jgi:hypothetical protein